VRILVGVDGGAASVRALRWAAEEADRLDLQVEVVLATSPPIGGVPRQGGRFDQDPFARLAAAVRSALPPSHRFRRRLVEHVVTGNAVRVLTERSQDAGLLVLGRPTGSDPLRSSTTAKCLRLAACPVAVIPAAVPEEDDMTESAIPESREDQTDAGVREDVLGRRPVQDVMTSRVLAVVASTEVDSALQLMVGAGVHHLPVMEHGRCVGLLHETDIVWRLAAWSLRGRPPTAGDVARKPAPAVSADRTVSEAAAEMFHRCGDAVVVSDGDQIVGILTTDDLLAVLARQPVDPELDQP
jgi:CBS domain-containing protein